MQHLRLVKPTQRNVIQDGKGRKMVRLLQFHLHAELYQPRRNQKETKVIAKHAISPKGLPIQPCRTIRGVNNP